MNFQEFCAFNGLPGTGQVEMLRNCHFPPERVSIDFTIVMYTLRGTATVKIDGSERRIRRRYMSVFREGQSIECLDMSEDFSCSVLLIGGSLGKALSISDVFLTLFVLDESPVIRVNSAYAEATTIFFEALSRVMKFQGNPYQEECLLSIMRAFFYSTGYYLYQSLNLRPDGHDLHMLTSKLQAYDEDSVVRRFVALVEKNAKTDRLLASYARKLDYHPKYLSSLIKRQTGRSGQDIIDQYAILTAVAKISYSHKSIKEISNEMEFPSQSDFGKFFKRMTGQSPLQYRKTRMR